MQLHERPGIGVFGTGRSARVVSPGCCVEVAGRPAPGAAPSRYVPNTTRARDELALEPWIDLDEGIRRMAAAHRG